MALVLLFPSLAAAQGPPWVTAITIGSPVVGDTFERGEAIQVRLTFNVPVDVWGTPQLALGIGTQTRQADVYSYTSAGVVTFRYVVVQADVDTDGLSIAANALSLNGGTIVVWGGTTNARLGLTVITNYAAAKVAGGTLTASAVSGAAITSSPNPENAIYVLGDTIDVAVTFNRAVTVTGTPQLALGIGTATRQANYISGTGTDSLTFRYAVQADDSDADGISVAATALGLNGGTINDARDATVAASLGLGTNAITNNLDHLVDGSAPVVTGVAIGSPVVGDTFERGDTIEVTVTFNKAVSVFGTTLVQLNIGSALRNAFYASGTGTRVLRFRYVVVQTDADADGLSIGEGALGGAGRFAGVGLGQSDAALALGANAITNSGSHKVAGGTFTAAAVSGVAIASSPASSSTYVLGEQIDVAVTFTRPVVVRTVTGTPQLILGVGTDQRWAYYVSGTGTDSLTFRYTVVAADSDADGISVGAAAVGRYGGTINDARDGRTAASLGQGTNTITNSSGHKVDGSQGPPGVTGVAIGSPAVGDTFERGERIEVTVTFNKAVDVTGTPQLALGIGSATRQASYASGTGTASLVFRYVVVQADADTDGLSIGAAALGLNGGTIDVAGGTTDAVLALGASAPGTSYGHKVAGGTFTASAVSGAAVASSPASGSTYGLGEQIDVAVTFTRPVTVTGTPQLALGIGTETRQANYVSGTGTDSLTFRYAVQAADSDANGLSVAATALGLNGGTINDARDGTTAASLGLGTNAIAASSSHKVDGSAPVVTGVAIGAPVVGDTFERGERIEVTVTFNKAVDVSGTPQLALEISSATRQASYASGTGTASLVFRYVVVQADADTDGLSIGADALGLNSGTIDVAGGTTDALLGLGAIAIENSSSHKVAGGTFTAAAVSGASIASTPASGSTYGLGERIEVRVTFNRAVTASGAPQLELAFDHFARHASYASGSSTATVLAFQYTVVAADRAAAGLDVGAAALSLNGGTINDARDGTTAASLRLGTNAIADDGDHKVDGSQGPPGVTGVAIGAPVVGDTFERGDTIEATVTFNKAVDVTGTPQLALGISSGTRQASYASGTGTASLVFRYTVVSGDTDTDGLSIAAAALGLNGGTIDVASGTTDAVLGLGASAIENSSSHKVAGGTFTAAAVSGASIASTPASGSTYGLGERIEVRVTFNRAVTASGAPQLALGVGSATRQASYASGSSTATVLAFQYTVVAADSDADGLSVAATALGLNGGTINDARDGTTAASLGLGTNAIAASSNHKVDGSQGPPGVTGVAIGAPVVGDTFERGDTIEATVTFNKAVDVTGTPQLALGIGSGTRQASYASGTGTASLVFRYTVVSGDTDTDGLSIAAAALGLNGGTIDVASGTTDAVLGLGASAIENSSSHKVAGGTFTAAAVSGASIASTPASGSTYGLGERIEVRVTFNRAVTASGAPQLALGVGSATRQASYASGSSTATVLAFQYTVVAADSDADGLSVAATALGLNGGTINDARDGTTAASLGLGTNAIAASSNHKVDGSQGPPGVTGVAIGAPVVGDTFERGDTIEATVTFNKAVDVTGTPQLALGIGSGTRQASYASGTGTASLVFRYTVVSGDADTDGLSIAAAALGLNGGTIDVASGTTDAVLGLGASAIENSSSHKVAGGTFTAAAVSGASIASTPASGSTYGLGERIEVRVTFNRAVTASGAPQLALGVGSATRQASYASGSSTATVLAFQYTVVAADSDADGLSVAATALGLNGGTINDARDGTTAASLGLGTNAIAASSNHKVDGSQGPPGVTGVAIGAPVVGDTFERGDTIEATVTFNKAVDVTGTPQLALGIGTATRQASYVSGTGTASLVFRYTVVSGDADTDGLSIAADALSLNSGTIDVAGGTTDALLGLGASAIENSGSHKVAGGTFTAAAVSGAAIASSPAGSSTYGLGEQIEVRVTFNRAVTVSGAPQLALGVGTQTRQASYASGSSTATVLAFQYTVVAGDSDGDGISVAATALGLNGGTINDARDGTTAASLGLGTNAIAASSSHMVDSGRGPPGSTGVLVLRPAVGDTYERGEVIEVHAWFNKAVDVTGTPQLALGIGTATRQASYDASGSGSLYATLVFRYTVVQADVDTDGLSIGANALSLNGGTIKVAGGTVDALLGLRSVTPRANDGDYKVDGGTFTAAAVSGAAIASTPASGTTYVLGEQIEVRVTFDRAVTATGAPQLALGVGTETRQASYASGSSTATVLAFQYTVAAADSDADGISVAATALGLNGGTINDARDGTTAASLGLGTNAIAASSSHKVDGSQGPPGVTGVAIGAPVVGDTFERGDTIEATVTFNKAVDVTGTPQLGLGIGSATRQAAYASGTGTASLVFRYTVVSGDTDTDGLSIGAAALGLNSGTIDVAGGATDAVLGLGASAIENSSSHKVAGSTFTAAAVSGASIASTPASGTTYVLGEQIEVRVTFNRAVTASGAPQLGLGVGTETRQASYASGSSTATVLAFQYTVVAADSDSDGLSVAATALGLNGGTINDARDGTTAASLGLGTNAIAASSSHKVDGGQGPPGVAGVAIGAPMVGDTFERGDTIEATVTFNKAVDVTGTPQLGLGIGSATRQAAYASGTGTASLVFRYTVVSGDTDTDGLSIGAAALGLNSGTIDVAGGTTDAVLGLGASAIENSSSHKVAGSTFTAAAVSGASIWSTPVSGSTYGLGERIEVRVTFDRAVTATGAPQLALGVGTETRQASYASGSSTATVLAFQYTVAAADSDADGISVAATALGLNGGTINDARDATVAASLGLGTNAIADDGDHKVDGSQGPPGVTGVAIGAPVVGDTFERDDKIQATVTFNKAVDVTGTPQLALGIGSATRQASYASGTGTASLVFRYAVVSGDTDTDGLSIGAAALGLNGGTIDVAGGTTDALLGLGASAILNSSSHKVAGGTFTAAAVSGAAIASSPSSGTTYGLGEQIEVRVTFNRALDVTGAPQLALAIGTETRQASYASGSSTATVLAFQYTVAAADSDANGLSVAATALGLNGGTINDARDATVAASLGLGTNAIADDGDHKVDGSQGPPGVTGVAIGAPTVDDTFERDDKIEATVTFNKAVDVTGAPQLALVIGTATRQASYASGTGTASLVFRYTVVSGDADTDGLSIGADALGLNGGTIDVAGGTTDALLGLGASAITNSSSHKVAGGTFTAAAVSGAAIASSPAGSSTYVLGEQIEVRVTFNRAVDVTGAPQLALAIGTATRQASYASGSSTATVLAFQYTVAAADSDADGLSVAATALGLNGGTINDARDGTTAASLGLGTNAIAASSSHKVDGSQGPPGVTGVAIGAPVVGDTFERGDTIEATVTFNKAVDVTGTPQLALGIGSATRQASYASGTGTASLVFRYTVVSGDTDNDGLSIGADALGLNSGTIDVAGGTTDALLGLGASAILNSSSHKVAGGTFTAAAVSGASIASSPSSGTTYVLGERIEVRVTFDRAVTATGAPQLALGVGTETRQASYASGSSTATVLAFQYTVAAADRDADGISVAATALGLNGGTINDARDATVAASLGLGTNAIAASSSHMVDGSQGPPGVTGVAIGAPVVGDTFERGEAIEATVTFNKAVDVTGTPQLALGIGSATRQASYASGTGTASLVFRYVVVSGDADTDGLSIGADALGLNSGTIDVAGGTTDALLGLGATAIDNSASHKVAGNTFTAAAVSDAAIASSPASSSTYGLGERIEVRVTFNRAVTVSGAPQLALGVGTETRQASYASGSSTATVLAFQYTVVAADRDADGLSVAATALGLNGGTINDARDRTTAASLGLGTNAIAASSSHKVDGSQGPPGVTGVAIGAPVVGDTFERGDTIEVAVTFNKAVDVTGTPQLALAIGSATRQASYASGTGMASLVFRYVVVQADADNDGLSIGADALGLNGGTIDVAGGTTDALLGLGASAIANSSSHKVAGGTLTAAAVSGAAIASSPSSGTTYGLGERIEVRVTFNRAVTATGAPQLALGVGTETRQASYASGSSTATVLAFQYTVAAADSDADGISVAATALGLNGGTINDARDATVAASLGLGTNAIAASSNHKVDGSQGPPGVTGVAIGAPVVGDTFERDDKIRATVTFNKAVDVTGTPQLALVIGTATRQASYGSGTGTTSLVFGYTVVQADADADGLSVGANALTLNGGTIDVAGGTTDALLGLGASAIENSSSHKVAGGTFTAAAVSGAAIASSPAGSSTYGLGEQIEVRVTFNRAVDVTGAPQLALAIGTATRQASYASGSSTATVLAFQYTVAAADSDADGISVAATALGLNGGTINDARDATVAASLGLGTNAIAASSNHKVDGSQGPPGVTGVAIGAPVVGDTFERGDTIEATVTFNKAVDVTGTPQLALGISSGTRQASYASGTGTVSLVFRYVVVQADADTDGLSIGAAALGLNSGTIDVAGGTTDALLGLGASAISNSSSHKVAGSTFTAAAVSGASIASSPASGTTYGLGEQIEVRVTFNRAVTATGAPQLALVIGTETRQASYASGSSTATVLAFQYTVVAADSDANGISVAATALGLNGGTINDARDGTTAASLGLGTNAIAASSSHMVDGSQGPPGVTGVAIGAPVVGDTFERGDTIEVTVTFNKAVDVSGTPQLALGIGSATRQASYASGTGMASLVFRYVVVQADADTDGLSIGAAALGLNSGTIDVAGGTTDALLGLGASAILNSSSHKVAGGTFTAAAVSGAAIASTPASGSTYGLGERIEVRVTFDRAVTATGAPQLALGVGTETRQASYASGSSTATVLAFQYTVAAADSDSDGISVAATALGLNGGTINDARDGTTAASLGLGTNAIAASSGHMVDGAQGPPGVTGVAIGAPVVGDTFERGEAIEVTVTFNKAVDVTGTPQLALGIGTQTRQASYASGTGTASLVFRYTVVSGDADNDGLSIGANALGLNSGTIDVAGGTLDALLGLGANAIGNSGSHKVAGGTFTAAAVNGAAIASSPASGSTYGLSERIEVAVTFTRPVTVSGAPQLALVIGSATRQASYASGTGTDSLTFRYAVVAADSDANGLSVGASALGLNGGTINDARDGATAASLGLGTNAITNSTGHKVDGSQGPPGVTGVAIDAPVVGDTFERGEAIEVTVTFNKAVEVDDGGGTPQLALGIGSATRQASYASGTGTASLVFRYTVVSGDADNDGLSIGANALGLNSGTIDVAGGTLDALLGLGANAIENSGSHKVAGGTFTAAAVSGAAITSTPSSSSTYGLGEQIEVQLTFTRPVTVSGAPQLALEVGTATRQASYASSPSTATVLVFRYTVQAADSDADGISVGATALTLNSGTINDARDGTTAASLGLGTNAITKDRDHKVDGAQGPPGVTGVAIGSPVVGDTFERGDTIEATVTFNKAVDVTGTPQLALGISSGTRQASYASGTGTASLVFRYVVASGDADTDGLSIGADALGLNSGTIDVAGGTTDALLGLGANAIENSGSHKVAGGTFTASAVSGASITSTPSSGSTYGLSERIEVQLTFTRPVTVSGAPQLALEVGSAIRQASYASSPSTATVLVFRYTVVSGDADNDGLSIGANALGLNSGTINDARDGTTAASLGLGTNAITKDRDHMVDGSQGPPGVTGVAIGSPVMGDTFERGDTIKATVTFNKAVEVDDVGGTPQLALGIGSATRQASYASGTGTASLVFRYVVVSGDTDTDGLSIAADALGLNGGKIGAAMDALLGLGANAIENSGSHKVAGGTFTVAAVSGASITSTPSSGSTYGLGEQIEVRVTFNRAVTVTGAPQLALGIDSAIRQAAYASSPSTATVLVFRYTVVSGDADNDGLSIGANALGLNSGTINDARDGTMAASLGLGTNAITKDRDHLVDGSQGPPGVTGVAIGSPVVGDTFERGDTIEATVTFNKAVEVDDGGGTPQLALGIGSATRQASYASGTRTASLVFRYVVVSGDTDTDGLSIAADALGLNGGKIGAATDAVLGLGANAIENSGSHKVAGGTFTASAVSGAAIASSPAGSSTYGLGERIEVRVTFNRAVTVTGAPQLALGIDSAIRQAAYASSPSTATVLVFRYTVMATDRDSDGLSVAATALGLNGGTINDARDATVAASLGLGTNAIAASSNHMVDGSQGPPGVTGVAIGAPVVGDTFERGEQIEVTVTFNKAVEVDDGGGTPQLALKINWATRQASYASGTGTASLVFRYTVVRADSTDVGLSIEADALGLNGGKIDVANGSLAALLDLGANAIKDSGSHKVRGDTVTPAAVSGAAITSTPSSGSKYGLGEQIEVQLTFNRAVTASGAPQLALAIGTETRQASYASGSSTATVLAFQYTVAAADSDTDGLSVAANALTLNGGTINDARDATVAASLGTNEIAASSNHMVDGSQGPPGVTGVAIGAPRVGGTFERGEAIKVTVTFNKKVDVTGTPQLALTLGRRGAQTAQTRQASYASGTGTASLVFQYTVVYTTVKKDLDSDGLSIGANALSLNGGTIKDASDATVSAALGLGANAIENSADHKVVGSSAAALVSGTAITSSPAITRRAASGSTYGLSETIKVQVTFDQEVEVDGTPQLALEIGSETRQANYVSGTRTATLTFGYRVQSADEDTDGISVGSGALGLNSGTIINLERALGVERPATLALDDHTISNNALHKVDGTWQKNPAVSGVEVKSTPGDSVGYGTGSMIEVDVMFSAAVDVTGTSRPAVQRQRSGTGEPRLALMIGQERRWAAYASGSGTAVLVFRYTVQAQDSGGLSVPEDALDLNGGQIVIAGGSAAAELGLGSHAMSDIDGQEVNGGGETDPYFGVSKYKFELTEDVAGPLVVGTVRATDPYGDGLTYVLGDGSEGLFELDASSGELTYVGTGEDAERRSEYLMEVRAEASDGRVGTALASVKVLNVNDAPVFVAEEFAFELAENVVGPVALGVAEAVDLDEGDTLTYRMEAGDGERFEVDGETGEVRYVGGGEDYEGGGPGSWKLLVSATDLAGLRVWATVAVALTNVNETPAFADAAYAFELAENEVGPVVLGKVRATDPDAGDRLTYSLAEGDGERFEVDGTSGEVRYVGGGEDAETGPASWELVVRATDGGGIEVEAVVTVSLLDRNEGPQFLEPSYEYEIEENAPGPIDLGVVGATDPDRADTLAYSLAGEDAERFEVDGTTGEVRYVGAGEDAETGPAGWEFEVVVADRGGLTHRAPVTVALLDVNEAPSFADSAYAFELAENVRGPRDLGRVDATDVDAGDVLTYGLASGDGTRFEVDGASGEVRYVGGGENYEDGPPRYALAVRVVDAGGLADEAGVVVTVLDVNEGPEAVGGIAPKVLEAYGAAAEEELGPYFRDPDGDVLSYAAESSAPGVALAAVTEAGRLSIAPQAIGVATVTVRATDPGGLEAMQQVQVTVEASTAERERALKLALTAFGRSLGAETVDAIGGRLGVESSSALGRSHVRLGGRSVGCGAFGGGGGEKCGLATLARGASGLLGARLSIPAATLVGPAGSPGATIDAATLLFGGGGAQGKGGFGGGTYQGQQESAAKVEPGGLEFDPLSRRNLLSQSSFQLSFGGGGAASFDSDADSLDTAPPQAASRAGWTLWGQASAGEFEGSPDDGFSLEGRTRSAYAGLDYRFGSGLLLGLAGSRSGMESDFESGINGAGSVDARLTSLYPYLHWSPREGLGLWGTAGAGRGNADFEELAGGRFSTDLEMRMGALGARQELVGALALKADAFSVRIQSADATDLAGVTANAQRVRLAPELSGQWAVGGASLRTRLELGGRLDRGDAETGMGAEAGAELGFTHRASGFSVDARGRTLLVHQAEDFKEWNASVALRLQPGRDQGGLSFSLEPSWGTGGGGAGALWQTRGRLGPGPQAMGGPQAMAQDVDAPGLTPARLAMELGWGAVLPGGGQIRPFGRWSREGTGGYRLNVGTQWSVLGGQPGEDQGQGAPGLRLMIDLFGEQADTGLEPTERRLGLLGRIEFR